jgi:hypothetical protein
MQCNGMTGVMTHLAQITGAEIFFTGVNETIFWRFAD